MITNKSNKTVVYPSRELFAHLSVMSKQLQCLIQLFLITLTNWCYERNAMFIHINDRKPTEHQLWRNPQLSDSSDILD